MDRRQETRVDVTLSVRIWGITDHSSPFMQLARVTNISSAGAVIQGVQPQVKPGAVVDVQYDGLKAQFRVVWTGRLGSSQEGEIGVEKLEAEPCIWGVNLPRCVSLVGNG